MCPCATDKIPLLCAQRRSHSPPLTLHIDAPCALHRRCSQTRTVPTIKQAAFLPEHRCEAPGIFAIPRPATHRDRTFFFTSRSSDAAVDARLGAQSSGDAKEQARDPLVCEDSAARTTEPLDRSSAPSLLRRGKLTGRLACDAGLNWGDAGNDALLVRSGM